MLFIGGGLLLSAGLLHDCDRRACRPLLAERLGAHWSEPPIPQHSSVQLWLALSASRIYTHRRFLAISDSCHV